MSERALVEVQRPAERLNWTKSGVLPRRLRVGTALGAHSFTCFSPSRHPRSPSPCPRVKLGGVARLTRPSNNLWRTSVNRARRSRNPLGSIAPPTLSRTSAALARGFQDVVLVGVRVLFWYLLCSALLCSRPLSPGVNNPRSSTWGTDSRSPGRTGSAPPRVRQQQQLLRPLPARALARDRHHLDF